MRHRPRSRRLGPPSTAMAVGGAAMLAIPWRPGRSASVLGRSRSPRRCRELTEACAAPSSLLRGEGQVDGLARDQEGEARHVGARLDLAAGPEEVDPVPRVGVLAADPRQVRPGAPRAPQEGTVVYPLTRGRSTARSGRSPLFMGRTCWLWQVLQASRGCRGRAPRARAPSRGGHAGDGLDRSLQEEGRDQAARCRR